MMPYIEDKVKRAHINAVIEELLLSTKTDGDLNYAITRLLHRKIQTTKLCYGSINTIIGVLECAKLEIYRQVAVPYEDKKKAANGSVSELDK